MIRNKNNKINILALPGELDCGGIETVLTNILKNINKEKFHIDFWVLTNRKCFYNDFVESQGSSIYHPNVSSKNILRKFLSVISLFRIMLSKKFMVVHSNLHRYDALVMLIAWICRIPVRISHSHNSKDSHNFTSNICISIITEKFIKLFATKLIACSKTAGEHLFGAKTQFKIIHNGIDPLKFSYNTNIRDSMRKSLGIENKFVIGHVGRFKKAKNHNFLIDIFYEVYKKDKNSFLLLVGSGELEKEIKKKVINLDLTRNVIFTGVRSDTSNLYQAMDCFVLPSFFEGFPVCAIEAQATGLPCVFSDNISSEIFLTEYSKYVSLKELSSAWSNVILEYRNFHRRNMTELIIEKKFDINTMVKEMEKIYAE